MFKNIFNYFRWKVVRKTLEIKTVVLDDGGYGWLPVKYGYEMGHEVVYERLSDGKRKTVWEPIYG
jgi:hypothetical protein